MNYSSKYVDEEAFWMKGEMSSRFKNKSSCSYSSSYEYSSKENNPLSGE